GVAVPSAPPRRLGAECRQGDNRVRYEGEPRTMGTMIGFTDNYQDRSTREGYQFEFFCERCGNGYTSSFKRSVTGFGGKLLRMGGDLLGGEIGRRASELGYDAVWMRDGNRGPAWDKALQNAVEEMRPHFT